MLPNHLEKRFTPEPSGSLALERRGDQASRIVGYGAVFYNGKPETEYLIYDDLVERIKPGCFNRALLENDVRSFFNHNEDFILGRKASGTLKLSVDRVGLRYEVTPPNSTAGQGVLESVRRRDVSGSSFMFIPRSVQWREEDGLVIRELHDVELFEVGPVVFPAYPASTSEVRNRLMDEASRHAISLSGRRPSLKFRQRQLALRARMMRLEN